MNPSMQEQLASISLNDFHADETQAQQVQQQEPESPEQLQPDLPPKTKRHTGITRVHWDGEEQHMVSTEVLRLYAKHPRWTATRLVRAAQVVLPAKRRRVMSSRLRQFVMGVMKKAPPMVATPPSVAPVPRRVFWSDEELATFDHNVIALHEQHPTWTSAYVARQAQRDFAEDRVRPASGPLITHVNALLHRGTHGHNIRLRTSVPDTEWERRKAREGQRVDFNERQAEVTTNVVKEGKGNPLHRADDVLRDVILDYLLKMDTVQLATLLGQLSAKDN